ncbi:uncharacterized protein NP_0630A [Natronomonas pharaonis DSM 2160]|uniref:Uncharacterized protein n=1 Tax=Natronomonas pharaonis (strain ATCC 35678 / DSM 2160 / CIP 103997 / JCM 8858 / NBRC 14720 / NCIMB 2260 / Gabara) TaxID=348780 RepID=A0A1U7ETZ6_NATPD|nr:hypothetical protein [Natronomonas pharaonis]CAI48406.1 uncharacterized protein NP_0630A [Natronomonas pharaonis DSM 2160]
MEETPQGTPVGVEDPYAVVERCDFLTDDGRCRAAVDGDAAAAAFVGGERDDGRCPAADPEGGHSWSDCPSFRARQRSRTCRRCGLAERRLAHDDERPLLEEHHLRYPDDKRREHSHEITVYLCRWCHSKVHAGSRIDDDADPDPEALAEAARRRKREQTELGFESAADRYGEDG